MSEQRAFDLIQLKRAARFLVGTPKVAKRFRRQDHADKITVFVASDIAGDPVWRKNTTESGFTLQGLTNLSVGEVEFYAVLKGGQVGLSLRSIYIDMRTPMKVEI